MHRITSFPYGTCINWLLVGHGSLEVPPIGILIGIELSEYHILEISLFHPPTHQTMQQWSQLSDSTKLGGNLQLIVKVLYTVVG